MLRSFSILLALSMAGPAFAQMTDQDMSDDHAAHDHADHQHAKHDDSGHAHADMDQSSNVNIATNGHAAGLALASTPELAAALEAGGQPVVAKVLGAVCDFCATAMNKTFGKRDDVAATYVDLDEKTLSLVLKPGAEMSDDTLRKVVKKAGYQVDVIDRDPALPTG